MIVLAKKLLKTKLQLPARDRGQNIVLNHHTSSPSPGSDVASLFANHNSKSPAPNKECVLTSLPGDGETVNIDSYIYGLASFLFGVALHSVTPCHFSTYHSYWLIKEYVKP